jgi:hypothetical protein
LHFPVRQQPHQRFIVQIHNLNAVAPRIAEVAAETGRQFELVFLGELAPYFLDLPVVADHEAEVFRAIGLELLDFEDGHELVFTEFAPSRAFATA